MAYEDLFKYIGDFGHYQKRIYFLLCLTAIPCGFHTMAGVFLNAVPKYRCQLPNELSNATYESKWINDRQTNDNYMIYPKDSNCQRYDYKYTDEYFASKIRSNNRIYCDDFIFDHSQYKSSTVTEWALICKKAYMRATSDALFMIGVLVGSIVFGQMSDNIGRKSVFFASLVLQVIFGVLAGIAGNFYIYTIARIMIGATTSGVFLVAYVLAMEMVGPSSRLFAGVAVQMFFSFGYIALAGFSHFFADWREFQIAITLPGLVFMCYYWIIPESARWLLSKNRKEEAIKIVKDVAKENKVIVPQAVLNNIDDDKVEVVKDPDLKEPSLIDLFRYPNLRKKTLLIFLDWFVNSATYYGLSWNTGSLGSNHLMNFVISGAVEFPAYTFLLFTLNRWGRRNILCGCMLVAGIMLLMTVIIPDQKGSEQNYAVIACAMFGKMAITASYGTIYVFTTEQFPTPVRNVGLGASSMMARIGGILAPYINVLTDVWKPLPLVIFGTLAFISGLLSLYLPETHGRKLPETIEEGELFGKKSKHDAENGLGNAEEMKKLNGNTGASAITDVSEQNGYKKTENQTLDSNIDT